MKKLLILLGVVGVSLSAPFIRISTAPSMVLVLYRVLLATILLLPYELLRNRKELMCLSGKTILLCLMSGLCLGLHFSCYFEAIHHTSIASAVALADTEVFFVAFMMFFIFREKIPGRAWAGILLTFSGSLLIALSDAGGGDNILLGDIIAIAAAACMAVYTIIGRTCRRELTTITYTLLVYFSASVTVLIILLFTGTPLLGYGPVNWLSALGMAVFCTLLGHSVFSWGLKYESAAFISTAKLLEPVFAGILGVLLFREIPKLQVIIGGCIVILGVYVYSRFAEDSSNKQR
ncbi:MAG: DMT family transporter [Synergistes sp.]|nr:DMT family transporter [Synergistes sp.]